MDEKARVANAAPNLILFNGNVITVDERFTIAQAVAIAGNRILAVRADRTVAEVAGPKTTAIDLTGKTVLPGSIDTRWFMNPRNPGRVECVHCLPPSSIVTLRGPCNYFPRNSN